MTSPVNTSVKHFISTQMPAAPILDGSAGSLIAVLDACLVNGFDLKTLTSLSVTSGVATATWTGTHSCITDSVILVAGVTGALTALNGEQKVISKTATSCTFATAAADGTAAGTITIKMTSAGWAKPFSGTNLAAYQATDVTGIRAFLRVDDTDTENARVVGYESMSDINTGTGRFPTQQQIADGGWWQKNYSTNGPKNWAVFCDHRTMLIFIASFSGSPITKSSGGTRMFGDAIALNPSGDAYATVLSCSPSNQQNYNNACIDVDGSAYHYFPREYTGLGGSVAKNTYPYTGSPTVSGNDDYFGNFPSPVDGGLKLSRKYFNNPSIVSLKAPRADLPGLYHVPQYGLGNSFDLGSSIVGAGVLAGRTLKAVTPNQNNTSVTTGGGAAFIDVTGPWR